MATRSIDLRDVDHAIVPEWMVEDTRGLEVRGGRLIVYPDGTNGPELAAILAAVGNQKGGQMPTVLKQLFSSKKFLALIAGMVVAVGGRLGFDLDETSVLGVLGACSAYMLSQGAADFGKEREAKQAQAANG